TQWLSAFERFWIPRLDALGTELARGRRQRRLAQERAAAEAAEGTASTHDTDGTGDGRPPEKEN
ncbi:MAG TPA: transcriptional regulator, partial [Citricoccus sp.]